MWQSIYFFPVGSLSDFIKNELPLFLERNRISDYFFILQYEPESHLRLRYLASETYFFTDCSHEFVPYEAEVERYGGVDSLFWAEKYFVASSKLALAFYGQEVIGRENFAVLSHLIASKAAKMDIYLAKIFFETVAEQWRTFAPAELATLYIQPQKAVKDFFELDNVGMEFFKAFEKEITDIFRTLRQILAGDQALFFRITADFVHLTNNRLGIKNQEESYIAALIAVSLS